MLISLRKLEVVAAKMTERMTMSARVISFRVIFWLIFKAFPPLKQMSFRYADRAEARMGLRPA